MSSALKNVQYAIVAEMPTADKLADARDDDDKESGDDTTPTTTVSECSEVRDDELDLGAQDAGADDAHQPEDDDALEDKPDVSKLGPGLFHDTDEEDDLAFGDGELALTALASKDSQASETHCTANNDGPAADVQTASSQIGCFTEAETLFVFDWDDTVLPSSWLQRQGLRLDDGSVVNSWQREQLNEVAVVAVETFRMAKQYGTVVLLTNAERGWIELSCQKFLPALYHCLEDVNILSARSTYESPQCRSPLDWKVNAFEAEIARACGPETLVDPSKRKNIHSIGDSVHEREALSRATCSLPNCRSKSLKLVERPDISQIVKQHALITSCFDQIVHHDGNLDLFISCS